jgi:hypothetical protein
LFAASFAFSSKLDAYLARHAVADSLPFAGMRSSSIYIAKRGRWSMTMGEQSRAMRARQAVPSCAIVPSTRR